MQRFTLPDLSPLPPAPPVPTAPGSDFSEAADSALAPADALAPGLASSVTDAASQRAAGEAAGLQVANDLAASQSDVTGLPNSVSVVDYSPPFQAAKDSEAALGNVSTDAGNTDAVVSRPSGSTLLPKGSPVIPRT